MSACAGRGQVAPSLGLVEAGALGMQRKAPRTLQRVLPFPGLEPRKEGPWCLLLPAEPQELIITGFQEIEACWEEPSSQATAPQR